MPSRQVTQTPVSTHTPVCRALQDIQQAGGALASLVHQQPSVVVLPTLTLSAQVLAVCRGAADIQQAGGALASLVHQQPNADVTGGTFECLLHTQVLACLASLLLQPRQRAVLRSDAPAADPHPLGPVVVWILAQAYSSTLCRPPYPNLCAAGPASG